VFNGYVSAKDRATGQPVRPLLLSVHADRDTFSKIVLDEPELDPTACLRGYLNAVISPHPWDLEPVKPVLQFDLKSWVTQASKDEGVDGVAVNEDPIVGGLCIIQAKRYSRIVDVESVHALAGVMDAKNAAKGVLVTTSWVGKASRDFAKDKGHRIQIIEGRELKHLLREHLGIDALISLPKLPPGWEQHDIT